MTKYFTVNASGMTAEQERALAKEWSHMGWWHAMPNFWLLRDHADTLDAMAVRDKVQAIAPSARIFVQEAQPTTWAASGVNEDNRGWLRKFWPPEGS